MLRTPASDVILEPIVEAAQEPVLVSESQSIVLFILPSIAPESEVE